MRKNNTEWKERENVEEKKLTLSLSVDPGFEPLIWWEIPCCHESIKNYNAKQFPAANLGE